MGVLVVGVVLTQRHRGTEARSVYFGFCEYTVKLKRSITNYQ